jgi:hypothetical protein
MASQQGKSHEVRLTVDSLSAARANFARDIKRITGTRTNV